MSLPTFGVAGGPWLRDASPHDLSPLSCGFPVYLCLCPSSYEAAVTGIRAHQVVYDLILTSYTCEDLCSPL